MTQSPTPLALITGGSAGLGFALTEELVLEVVEIDLLAAHLEQTRLLGAVRAQRGGLIPDEHVHTPHRSTAGEMGPQLRYPGV